MTMTHTILSTNHRKAALSFAYLAALSAFAGYRVSADRSRTRTASTGRPVP